MKYTYNQGSKVYSYKGYKIIQNRDFRLTGKDHEDNYYVVDTFDNFVGYYRTLSIAQSYIQLTLLNDATQKTFTAIKNNL